MIQLFEGDCLEVLKTLEENSVDSIVTDPPYELGFMGKSWDNTGIANNPIMWAECLRVLKPGGHLLAFSGTRTYHRMASAIEDAGFEVRDMIEWIYGSGFPKSLNIVKAVDKLQGNEREDVGESKRHGGGIVGNGSSYELPPTTPNITKGTSEWEGWGTALKPAHEPICMARKPLAEKTVAENVLKYGTGGINIDESRVLYNGDSPAELYGESYMKSGHGKAANELQGMSGTERNGVYVNATGRFPANLIHDNSEEVRECFPEQKSGAMKKAYEYTNNGYSLGKPTGSTKQIHESNSGNASRFFKSIIYQAKSSKSERNKGCEGLEEKYAPKGNNEGRDMSNPKNHLGGMQSSKMQNNHPTVKPIALMSYLIKMVTPEGGTVLDPFMGSGSTGVAAKQNSYSFIGIDMTPEYVEIAMARIESVL